MHEVDERSGDSISPLLRAESEKPQRIDTGEYRCAGICEDGDPEPRNAENSRHQNHRLESERDRHVLPDVRLSDCWASSASVCSPSVAAMATFALMARLWFRRDRFIMIAPRSPGKDADLARTFHSVPLFRLSEPPLSSRADNRTRGESARIRAR